MHYDTSDNSDNSRAPPRGAVPRDSTGSFGRCKTPGSICITTYNKSSC